MNVMRTLGIAAGALLASLGSPPAARAAEAAFDVRDVVALRPDADRGRELFAACAACHGGDGAGGDRGSVPAIAGQHYTVLARQLVDYRRGRRWDIRMESQADSHRLADAQAISDVAGYVSGLPRLLSGRHGDGEHLARGARVYFERCERCHGPVGEGEGEGGIPRLAGQHYEYLLRQFYDAPEGRRPNMPAAHRRLMRALVAEDIRGISDYLSRLAPRLVRESDAGPPPPDR